MQLSSTLDRNEPTHSSIVIDSIFIHTLVITSVQHEIPHSPPPSACDRGVHSHNPAIPRIQVPHPERVRSEKPILCEELRGPCPPLRARRLRTRRLRLPLRAHPEDRRRTFYQPQWSTETQLTDGCQIIQPCIDPGASVNATCSLPDLLTFEASVNATCAFFNATGYTDYATCPNLLAEFIKDGDI